MQNDVYAEDTGTNVSDTETLYEETVEEQEGTQDLPEHVEAPKKGVPKLLSERRALKEENEQLKAQLEDLARKVASEVVDEKTAKEKFISEHGEEAYKDAEAVLKKYPNLSFEDAHLLAQRNQSKFEVKGTVPQAVTNPEAKPKSLAELEAGLRQAFAEGKLNP